MAFPCHKSPNNTWWLWQATLSYSWILGAWAGWLPICLITHKITIQPWLQDLQEVSEPWHGSHVRTWATHDCWTTYTPTTSLVNHPISVQIWMHLWQSQKLLCPCILCVRQATNSFQSLGHNKIGAHVNHCQIWSFLIGPVSQCPSKWTPRPFICFCEYFLKLQDLVHPTFAFSSFVHFWAHCFCLPGLALIVHPALVHLTTQSPIGHLHLPLNWMGLHWIYQSHNPSLNQLLVAPQD